MAELIGRRSAGIVAKGRFYRSQIFKLPNNAHVADVRQARFKQGNADYTSTWITKLNAVARDESPDLNTDRQRIGCPYAFRLLDRSP
jgi:hypothetical protein